MKTQTKQAAKQTQQQGASAKAGQSAMKSWSSKSNGNYGKGMK